MDSWKPDICIYHFPCDDGFAAAWAVHQRWGDDVTYQPMNYGQQLNVEDYIGKNILVVDFSFDYETCCALSFKAKSVVILDHHKSAKEALERLPPLVHLTEAGLDEAFKINWSQNTPEICAHFDMDKSGARLAWEFCFPDSETHGLIKFVEDRDLWRFKYSETRKISLLLRSYDYDFKVWTEFLSRFSTEYDKVMAEATAIERFYDKKIAEILPTAEFKKIGNYDDVPVAHAPYSFASDVAHGLLEAHPEAPFAAVAVDAYGGRTYSLRSTDEREDVSKIAKQFGGGGHRNAAGFRMPI